MTKAILSRTVLTAMLVLSPLGIYLPTHAVAQSDLPKSLRIATHPQGAAYYVLGSAFAKVLSDALPLSASVRPFSGFQAWFPELDRNNVDMGIATGYDLGLAVKGKDPYPKIPNVRTLSVGTDLLLGLAVKDDSPIKTLADLKGKRVTINRVLQGSRDGAEAQIRAAGLDPERDIIVVPVTNVVQPPQMLMEGRVDAAWGAPAMPQIREADVRLGGVRFLPAALNDGQARHISENFTGYRVINVKGGSVTGVRVDTLLMASPINMVANTKMSDGAAYQILKTVWNSYDKYKGLHPWAQQWTHAKMTENLVNSVAPFHAGAVRFYKELGIWDGAAEKHQQKLLAGS